MAICRSQRNPAVRRGAVGERVQEESKATAKLLLAETQGPEEPFLNVLAVNPDAPGAQLVAVEHQVVALERTSQGADSSFSRSSSTMPVKGCCALTQALSRHSIQKAGAGDPQKLPRGLVDEPPALRRAASAAAGDSAAASVAFDLLPGRAAMTDHRVCTTGFDQLRYVRGADQFSTLEVVPSVASLTK